jgi:hypothetical protein
MKIELGAGRPMRDIRFTKIGSNEGSEKRQVSTGRKAGLWTADQLRARLRKYDRTPFIDVLALWMECTPNAEVIEKFAEVFPDKFVKALEALGRLSGYAEKREIDVNLTAQVSALSDSQLEDRVRRAAQKIGLDMPEIKVLEHEPISSSGSEERNPA